jgi:hypothetical protein
MRHCYELGGYGRGLGSEKGGGGWYRLLLRELGLVVFVY